MKLTVIGSGTLVPHPERGTPGLAVSAGEDTLLFDGGSGTMSRLARSGLDWKKISNLFYTHLHPDHTLDLVSFLFANNYAPGFAREGVFRVHGPHGIVGFYNAVTKAWPSIVPKDYPLELVELSHGQSAGTGEPWLVEAALACHGENQSLAYRVASGAKSIVYTGDTDYCPEVADLARGADLLVAECSTDDTHAVPGHLCPSRLARIVNESGVRNVLLVHIYPLFDPEEMARCCREFCNADVRAANDLETCEV